ncbi:MAG: orotidine-5'-phosphate decarboxylase [Ignavibacteriaceae bacterium]|nr:orotidine-5'-phosphate decarboxylase [Ignavibacteriaceae bacterium]
MNALKKLQNANSIGNFICVGLDTDIKKIPPHLLGENNPIVEFNKQIIDATKDRVAAYKINLAFYECYGINGLKNLEDTIKLIPSDVITIADGKRGDIGNTSKMHAQSFYEHYNFDCSTLNPLMGKDSLEPFLDYSDKLNFILVLTSNPGSKDFQNEELKNGVKLFQHTLNKIREWDKSKNCGIVFGATKLNELLENLHLIENLPILIPGIGAQGGNLEDLVKILFESQKKSFLVNVSRGIIYKSNNVDFAEQAAAELTNLNNIISANKK